MATSPDAGRPGHVWLPEEKIGEPFLPPLPRGSLDLGDKGQNGALGHQVDTGYSPISATQFL